MTDDPAALVEAHWKQLEETAETMWHEEFSRIVIERLAVVGAITVEDLRDTLERKMSAPDTDRITRAKCHGALRALRA